MAGRVVHRRPKVASLFYFVFLLAVAHSGAAETAEKPMQLTSPGFAAGEPIPVQYTCDGRNVSPPLKWSGTPSGAKSLVLVADDPDAPGGTWVHWVLYDLPATTAELPEDCPKSQYLPGRAAQGLNDFKHLGYGGPCPPPGKPHRYFFKLYALNAPLGLKPGSTQKEVDQAMSGRVLATAQLMGVYKRK